MLVYRVEDSEGMGPYNQTDRNGFTTDVACSFRGIHDGSKDHPHPLVDRELRSKVSGKFGADIGLYIESTALFGFTSLSSFYRWFGSHLHMLRNGKFKVSVFDVPDSDVIYSDKQAMFLTEQAVLLKRIKV